MGAFADEVIHLGRQLVTRAAQDQVCLLSCTPYPATQFLLGWGFIRRQSYTVSAYKSHAIMDYPTMCGLHFFYISGFSWILMFPVIIIGMTQLLAYPLSKIRQPRVIAEVIAGIILGPTGMLSSPW